MKYLSIIFCQIFLLGLAFSSPVETKAKETSKKIQDTTTQIPPQVSTSKNINKEQVQSTNNAQNKKPMTKKRDIPEILADKTEYLDDDFYEGRPADDYDAIQALKSYLDNTRHDSSLLGLDKYKGNDYRYYDEEARRKRTAVFDGLFNKPDGYYEPEIQLTPEDIAALAAYKQQQRLYNGFPYGRWSDINNPIDLPEPDVDPEEVYNERPENFFDRFYDRRYQNWANIPRSDKFIASPRRRSVLGSPKLRVPIYGRAIL